MVVSSMCLMTHLEPALRIGSHRRSGPDGLILSRHVRRGGLGREGGDKTVRVSRAPAGGRY
jgi:hypothetical protein